MNKLKNSFEMNEAATVSKQELTLYRYVALLLVCLLVQAEINSLMFCINNESIVSVEERSGRQPSSLALLQNYPNPFNPSTTITYEISVAGQVQLTIYNLLGQIVKKLVEMVQGAGSYNVVWDGKADAGLPVASGIYVFELRVRKQLVERKKMVLIH